MCVGYLISWLMWHLAFNNGVINGGETANGSASKSGYSSMQSMAKEANQWP